MTPADVQRVAQTWLDDKTQVTLRYRDESQRPAGYAGHISPDLSKMGPALAPARQPPVVLASEGVREARPGPAQGIGSATGREKGFQQRDAAGDAGPVRQ